MRILIDMNLSPEWVEVMQESGISAVHWSTIGKYDAPDVLLIQWAKEHDYIVFSHDLDFGTALALTRADKPSVIQVRTQDVTVSHLKNILIPVLQRYEEVLQKGALIIIDETSQRIRILPL
ncbi:putative nuclease of predicted toxin-antitoxin system [Arcticibacter tournemirensis]|uniref:DUF5615 domain-containing protein n=2 Tax=Arcticibacter tournemirensis TaxID=699437 RepID=A0A5M9HK92_9SPHI|nr:hypothetical protein F1649_04645 [Arcticibacter tournemirensis]TQM50297.1 putative nuclease of predicted toxin-antitoxin system [Arcticibacter tournemirensis]